MPTPGVYVWKEGSHHDMRDLKGLILTQKVEVATPHPVPC